MVSQELYPSYALARCSHLAQWASFGDNATIAGVSFVLTFSNVSVSRLAFSASSAITRAAVL